MTNRPLDHQAIPENFLAHLQQRLGVGDEATASSILGDWISSYQPGPAALARASSRPEPRRNAA